MSDPPPGLAVERTVLAWWRTWLAVAGCGLLLLRMSIGSPALVRAALAVAVAALVLITAAGRRRAAHLRAIAPHPSSLRAATAAAGLTTATVMLFGLAAAALVVAR